MKIVFNLHNVGLGNNGGSRTLIRSGETLASLGAEVVMYSNLRNRYTWHKPRGVKFVTGARPPKADVAIATGVRSVASTVNSNAKRKMYYIRGLETWIFKERQLIKSFKKLECIVNSIWLQKFLATHGIKSRVLYPGLDFDWFRIDPNAVRSGVGGIFHRRHGTKRHKDVIHISNLIGSDLSMLNRDLVNASPKQSRKWYNTRKVWVAPTELEGLHNPPMEAALCGCALVCTNHPRSGMQDYAIHEQTALVYPERNLKRAAKYTRRLLEDESLRLRLNENMINLLKTKIGDRKTNMQRLLKWIR